MNVYKKSSKQTSNIKKGLAALGGTNTSQNNTDFDGCLSHGTTAQQAEILKDTQEKNKYQSINGSVKGSMMRSTMKAGGGAMHITSYGL